MFDLPLVQGLVKIHDISMGISRAEGRHLEKFSRKMYRELGKGRFGKRSGVIQIGMIALQSGSAYLYQLGDMTRPGLSIGAG